MIAEILPASVAGDFDEFGESVWREQIEFCPYAFASFRFIIEGAGMQKRKSQSVNGKDNGDSVGGRKERAPGRMRRGNRLKNSRGWSISFNSPVVLCFALICLVAWLMGWLSGGRTTTMFFSVYRASLSSPFTYVRLIGHVFGHASLDHLLGNMTLLLIIGPMLEEKYGSLNLLVVILITAFVTGIASFLLFPHTQLLGASGVVSAFILLSSFTSIREHYIPLTFLLVAIFYLGGQIYEGIFVPSNISNFTHILGGVVGAWFGFFLMSR